MHKGRNYPIAQPLRVYDGQWPHPLWMPEQIDFHAQGWIQIPNIHAYVGILASDLFDHSVHPGSIVYRWDWPTDLPPGSVIITLTMNLAANKLRMICDYELRKNGVLQQSQSDVANGGSGGGWIPFNAPVAPGAQIYATSFTGHLSFSPTFWP